MKESAIKEGAKRTPLFGVRKMFTSDFLDMIRGKTDFRWVLLLLTILPSIKMCIILVVHMSQNDMTWTTAELVFRLNEHVNTLLREKKQKEAEPTAPAEAETQN